MAAAETPMAILGIACAGLPLATRRNDEAMAVPMAGCLDCRRIASHPDGQPN